MMLFKKYRINKLAERIVGLTASTTVLTKFIYSCKAIPAHFVNRLLQETRILEALKKRMEILTEKETK